MSIFNLKKKKEDKVSDKAPNQKPVKSDTAATVIFSGSTFILRPRITEKATAVSEKGVYVFEVSKDANKRNIKKSIISMYKVTPAKIRIANIPSKKVFVRGKWGVKSGGRKAYVYLKKGESITIT